MRQHESRLVLDAEIAAQLQGGNTLHGIGVDCYGDEVDLERQFVEGEDGAARHREGVFTGFAAQWLTGDWK